MKMETEQRMISGTGYAVKQSFLFGGKEIMLAENQHAEDGQFYLVCDYAKFDIISEYSRIQTDGDFLEAVREFTERIGTEATAIRAETEARALPGELFAAGDCHPHDYGESIKGEVVVIKPSAFSPEYRRGEYQLVYVAGGNGTFANPRGNAVYCYHLNTGAHTRFERFNVLGIIKELPGWAKESLARIQSEMEKPAEEKEFAGSYEIIERIEVGQKLFVMVHCEKAPNPYGTWQGYKNSKGDFDWGHYFNSRETAKTDMHDRAAKEQERLEKPKRDDKGR
jgi:hypothetical protein